MEYYKEQFWDPQFLDVNGLLNLNVDAQNFVFTDNTVILCQEKNEEQLYKKSNSNLKKVKTQFHNILLELNINKTKHCIWH